MRLGIAGISPGNGHPFSFSAIVNGYSAEGFAEAGWPVILDYLQRRRSDEFGFDDVRVSHAWTQDETVTMKLCRACLIENAVPELGDLIGNVDGLILARDDAESHYEMAMPFLEAGIPVFVDKPLTLDRDQLEIFYSYIVQGKLMSCSGMRFCGELDELRQDPTAIGDLRVVRAVVLNDWARYGIHMVDAVLGALPVTPISVTRLPATHDSLAVRLSGNALLTVDALGEAEKVFDVSFYGSRGRLSVDLLDNFTAFRRTLGGFIDMVRNGRPAVPPEDTWRSVATIIAGNSQKPGDPAAEVPPPPALAAPE